MKSSATLLDPCEDAAIVRTWKAEQFILKLWPARLYLHPEGSVPQRVIGGGVGGAMMGPNC
jgi:hypothetical protein